MNGNRFYKTSENKTSLNKQHNTIIEIREVQGSIDLDYLMTYIQQKQKQNNTYIYIITY